MFVDRKKVFGICTFTSGKITMDSIPAKNIHRNVNEASSCLPALTGGSVVALQVHVGQSRGGQGEPSDTRALRFSTRFSNVVFVSEGSTDEVLETKTKNETAENFTISKLKK